VIYLKKISKIKWVRI